jgi:hypothetical protein
MFCSEECAFPGCHHPVCVAYAGEEEVPLCLAHDAQRFYRPEAFAASWSRSTLDHLEPKQSEPSFDDATIRAHLPDELEIRTDSVGTGPV